MRHGSAARSLGQHLFHLTQDARLLVNHFTNLKTARETADHDPNRSLAEGDCIQNFRVGSCLMIPSRKKEDTYGEQASRWEVLGKGGPP